MGCDFVSGQYTHTQSSTLFVSYMYNKHGTRCFIGPHAWFRSLSRDFWKRGNRWMMLLLRLRGFYTVMSSLPAYLKYDGTNWLPKSASTAGERSSAQISKEGYLGFWKFKLRSTKRKDLFVEMSLESSTSWEIYKGKIKVCLWFVVVIHAVFRLSFKHIQLWQRSVHHQ